MLTAENVREVFDYDQATGVLRWRVQKSNNVRIGERAGHTDRKGYLQVWVDGHRYFVHRLAWLHVYGQWPRNQIDHINGDPADNRIANLRDVTQRVNQQNRHRAFSKSRTGILGVCPSHGKFRATIQVDGKTKNLGEFVTAEEARRAYVEAKQALHPGYAA